MLIALLVAVWVGAVGSGMSISVSIDATGTVQPLAIIGTFFSFLSVVFAIIAIQLALKSRREDADEDADDEVGEVKQ